MRLLRRYALRDFFADPFESRYTVYIHSFTHIMDLESLIFSLKEKGVLRDPRIEDALRSVDRKNFVPPEFRDSAYLDDALPIGFNQTISQPYTVVFMLELLEVAKGEKVLDIGYGSGWQTALLAHLVGDTGLVYGLEIVRPLCDIGAKNIATYPDLAARITLECRDASSGAHIPRGTYLDKIIVAAEVDTIPKIWREQLRVGGRMVYPSHGSIFVETNLGAHNFAKKEFPGFAFVPFVSPSRGI